MEALLPKAHSLVETVTIGKQIQQIWWKWKALPQLGRARRPREDQAVVILGKVGENHPGRKE